MHPLVHSFIEPTANPFICPSPSELPLVIARAFVCSSLFSSSPPRHLRLLLLSRGNGYNNILNCMLGMRMDVSSRIKVKSGASFTHIVFVRKSFRVLWSNKCEETRECINSHTDAGIGPISDVITRICECGVHRVTNSTFSRTGGTWGEWSA